MSSATAACDASFVADARALVAGGACAAVLAKHYLSAARKHQRLYFAGCEVPPKKYFYVARPLVCALWLAGRPGLRADGLDEAPPMLFDALAGETPAAHARESDARALQRLQCLLADHSRGASPDLMPRERMLDDWVERLFEDAERAIAAMPGATGRRPLPAVEPFNELCARAILQLPADACI
eukprot:m51a1_g1975 hypothetical protein (183) ;mRNA; f:1110097-1110735